MEDLRAASLALGPGSEALLHSAVQGVVKWSPAEAGMHGPDAVLLLRAAFDRAPAPGLQLGVCVCV